MFELFKNDIKNNVGDYLVSLKFFVKKISTLLSLFFEEIFLWILTQVKISKLVSKKTTNNSESRKYFGGFEPAMMESSDSYFQSKNKILRENWLTTNTRVKFQQCGKIGNWKNKNSNSWAFIKKKNCVNIQFQPIKYFERIEPSMLRIFRILLTIKNHNI